MAKVLTQNETIDTGRLYPLENFKAIAGLGQHAMRQVRRAGLPIKRIGRVKYVLGDDYIQFVKDHGLSDISNES